MSFTILETAIRNQERRRCRRQAHEEGKTFGEVVSDEGQRRLVRQLARELAPELTGATAPPKAEKAAAAKTKNRRRRSTREDKTKLIGSPEEAALCVELRQIGSALVRIVEVLEALERSIHALPANAGAPAGSASTTGPKKPPRRAENEPRGDKTAVIDQVAAG
jgi:hypothetical protein